MTQRIQLSRRKGWRKPEGAIVVTRPSRWGNPFRVLPSPAGGYYVRGEGRGKALWSPGPQVWSRLDAIEVAVDEYRKLYRPHSINAHDARIFLAGYDLACWCPLDQPCHADVLLELANGGAS